MKSIQVKILTTQVAMVKICGMWHHQGKYQGSDCSSPSNLSQCIVTRIPVHLGSRRREKRREAKACFQALHPAIAGDADS